MEGQFKVGDVVQLKSGGPKMTVVGTEIEGAKVLVTCQWFDGTKLATEVIIAEALREYKVPRLTVR